MEIQATSSYTILIHTATAFSEPPKGNVASVANTLIYIIEKQTLHTKKFLMEKETEEICKLQMTFHNAVKFLLY